MLLRFFFNFKLQIVVWIQNFVDTGRGLLVNKNIIRRGLIYQTRNNVTNYRLQILDCYGFPASRTDARNVFNGNP